MKLTYQIEVCDFILTRDCMDLYEYKHMQNSLCSSWCKDWSLGRQNFPLFIYITKGVSQIQDGLNLWSSCLTTTLALSYVTSFDDSFLFSHSRFTILLNTVTKSNVGIHLLAFYLQRKAPDASMYFL